MVNTPLIAGCIGDHAALSQRSKMRNSLKDVDKRKLKKMGPIEERNKTYSEEKACHYGVSEGNHTDNLTEWQ